MGTAFLTHLHTAWHVDQAILANRYEKVTVIRFGRNSDPACTAMDEILWKCEPRCKKFGEFYVVDIGEVKDFNVMYELVDPCTVMFFFNNKHIQVDFGTGDNNKINFPIGDKQEMIDIFEVVYRGARKGRGLVVSPKDYAFKWAY